MATSTAITYTYNPNTVTVLLDGKRVGLIRPVEGGYQYCPINSNERGQVFKTLWEVQTSLEDASE